MRRRFNYKFCFPLIIAAKIFAPALLKSRTVGRISATAAEEQEERRTKFLARLMETNVFSKTIFNLAERSMPLVDIS